MAEEELDATHRFITHSLLDLIIPEASQLDIEEALSSASANADDDDAPTGLAAIPQRKTLFFDEQLPVFVVLQTPYQEENGLKAYIAQLSISVEAHAINGLGAASNRDGTPQNVTREVLWSGKVDTKEDPVIVVEEADDGEDGDQRDMFIIWRMTTLLTRPRTRLQAPGILFKLSGTLESIQSSRKDETNDPYLRSGVPFASQNIFQALERDASLKGAIPYLPASRLSHLTADNQSSRSRSLPLKAVSRRATRAQVALSAKFRHQRPRAATADSSAWATLDLDVPAYAQHSVAVNSVAIEFPSGHAKPMTPPSILALPKRCQPRDNITFLYNLAPDKTYTDSSLPSAAVSIREIEISVTGIVLVSPLCSPAILLNWRTTVDVSPPQTGGGAGAHHRTPPPSSTKSQTSRQSTERTNPAKTSVDSQRSNGAEFGISATLSAIDDVRVGEPFHWEIFLVNHSAATRRLRAAVITQSSCNGGSRQGSTMRGPTSRRKEGFSDDAAPAYVDEFALFDIARNARLDLVGLVCLSTDLDVEPLAPDACSTFSLALLPLLPGRLDLAAIRFVDKETGEALDIKTFPDVIVQGRGGSLHGAPGSDD